MNTTRSFFFRHQLAIILLILLAALVVSEIVLHQFPLSPYITDLILQQGADLVVHRPSSDARLLYELAPGMHGVFKEGDGPIRRVTINQLGLRDKERTLAKPAGVFRIVVLGSSTTYGAIVTDGATLTDYLEELLNQRNDGVHYEVWNTGVSAYTPLQEAALAEKLIEEGLEADVLLFQIHIYGPRAFLFGEIQPLAFAADPSLLAEHFLLPSRTPLSLMGELGGRSRLALMLLAHGNRMAGVERREKELLPIQVAHHVAAMQSFMDQYGTQYRVAALNVPCRDDNDNFEVSRIVDPAGIPTWCVSVDQSDPDNMLLHPPAHVYERWAQTLAQMLAERGFLAKP